jgi:hypothetical protein
MGFNRLSERGLVWSAKFHTCVNNGVKSLLNAPLVVKSSLIYKVPLLKLASTSSVTSRIVERLLLLELSWLLLELDELLLELGALLLELGELLLERDELLLELGAPLELERDELLLELLLERDELLPELGALLELERDELLLEGNELLLEHGGGGDGPQGGALGAGGAGG